MHTYQVEVYRDGRWYMIRMPEFDGLTQARYPGEIGDMARSYIAHVGGGSCCWARLIVWVSWLRGCSSSTTANGRVP
jgi:hypothetical protein